MKSPPQAQVCGAIAAARVKMARVHKGCRNEFDGYDYAELADFLASVEEPMHEAGLILITSVVEVQELPARPSRKGGQQNAVRVKILGDLIHASSGESIEVTCWGEGQDRGDKAVYKAITGGRKYLLAILFNLATGDDPERPDPDDKGIRQPPPPTKSGTVAEAQRWQPAGLSPGEILQQFERSTSARYAGVILSKTAALLRTDPDWPVLLDGFRETYKRIVEEEGRFQSTKLTNDLFLSEIAKVKEAKADES